MKLWHEFNADDKAVIQTNLYGLPCTEAEAEVVVLPVPWEATTSYGSGASAGPDAILQASLQQDLFQADLGEFWKRGISLRETSPVLVQVNETSKETAQRVINEEMTKEEKIDCLNMVNENSESVNEFVYQQTAEIYQAGKLPVILGGDHSVPLGAFRATADRFGDFGILHFDAHAGLRDSYLGFTYSHASIMFNALKIAGLTRLVQVGIRDFGKSEMEIIKNDQRLMTFFDRDIQEALNHGAAFSDIVGKIVESLPKRVWVSFDIDGLDPSLCPNTGTPVVGGLSFSQADAILKAVSKSGIKIVGMDLNEVAPSPDGNNEWDANVGMRLLYRMIGHALSTKQ